MKRFALVAALALSPSLLHAQAAQPANLQARLASPTAVTSSATATAVRVSTGVVAPKLLAPVNLADLPGAHPHVAANDLTVTVSLTVDATGKASEVAIAQSAGETLDQQVLAAVHQYRFQPGTLDGQPYAVPVRLQVIVQRGAQY